MEGHVLGIARNDKLRFNALLEELNKVIVVVPEAGKLTATHNLKVSAACIFPSLMWVVSHVPLECLSQLRYVLDVSDPHLVG